MGKLYGTAALPIALALATAACAHRTPALLSERIQQVESGLLASYGDPAWRRMRLEERMAELAVPALSIAVVDNFELDWARAYGVMEVAGGEAVSPASRFQGASIGKVIVAAAALTLVDQGRLDLDADVNSRLTSWRVPENEFTSSEKVTLRRLLSHSAGVTVSGFRGYGPGEDVPGVLQVLDGVPPANSAPVRVDSVPGSIQRYSGGGYMIVQQLIEDVTGKPFAEFMNETVFAPVGMAASTFDSPLPAQLEHLAVTGYRTTGDPIPGKWHTYPEQGTGASLWTTPSDLARFAIALMRSFAGGQDEFLAPGMTRAMLTPVIDARGLGPTVHDDGGDRFYFMHPGGNEGFRCVLVAYPKRGQAVIIMTNSDAGEALWHEVLRSVSITYGWVT